MPIGRILQLGFQRYQYAGHPRRLQNRTIASEAPEVLQQEHRLYVRTLQRIATGEIELQGL